MPGHIFEKAERRLRRDRHVRPTLERCESRIAPSGFAAVAVRPASAVGAHEISGALIKIN